MTKLRSAAATIAVMALAAAPMGIASASSSQAGQHGNHCGLGHSKHVNGQGGLKIGQTCQKAHHGGGDENNGDDAGDDASE
jgi:hypothetical protein